MTTEPNMPEYLTPATLEDGRGLTEAVGVEESLREQQGRLDDVRAFLGGQIQQSRDRQAELLALISSRTVGFRGLPLLERAAWDEALKPAENHSATFEDYVRRFQHIHARLQHINDLVSEPDLPLLVFKEGSALPTRIGSDPFALYLTQGTGLHPSYSLKPRDKRPVFSFDFEVNRIHGGGSRSSSYDAYLVSTADLLRLHDTPASARPEIPKVLAGVNDDKERFIGRSVNLVFSEANKTAHLRPYLSQSLLAARRVLRAELRNAK